MATGPGAFGAYIQKLMDEGDAKGVPLRAAAVCRLSGNKINKTRMHAILHGYTPWDIEIVDSLAKALKVDRQFLRDLAAQDWIAKSVENFTTDESKIFGQRVAASVKLPLVQSKDLNEILSRSGYPTSYSHQIPWHQDYGPRAYAIVMNDASMDPKASVGDTCIVKPTMRIRTEDFGLLGTKKQGVLIGRLKGDKNNFQVILSDATDYDIVTIPRNKVMYVFRIEVVIRGNLDPGRSSPGRK
jgi:hypothetical protein